MDERQGDEGQERELSSKTIILELGEIVAKKIKRKVIYDLRHTNATIEGTPDIALNTFWDEYCVQVQDERFFEWSMYEDIVRSEIRSQLEALVPHEREALWLTTYEAGDWFDCSENYDGQPVKQHEILQHLYDSILEIAEDWTNRRIERYHHIRDR